MTFYNPESDIPGGQLPLWQTDPAGRTRDWGNWFFSAPPTRSLVEQVGAVQTPRFTNPNQLALNFGNPAASSPFSPLTNPLTFTPGPLANQLAGLLPMAGPGGQLPAQVPGVARRGGGLGRLLGRNIGGGWKGTLGVGLGAPIAGQVLGGLVGGQESGAGRFLAGAGTGAGLGAGVGSFIPGIGTAAGAGIGALAGGLLGAFGGGGKQEGLDVEKLLAVPGVTPEIAAGAAGTYEAFKDILGKEQAQQLALAPILELVQAQETAAPAALAQQMLASLFMQPYVADSMAQSAAQEQAIGSILGNEALPPSFRAVYEATAPSLGAAQRRLASSSALAAQVAPYIQALENPPQGATSGDLQSLIEQFSQQ